MPRHRTDLGHGISVLSSVQLVADRNDPRTLSMERFRHLLDSEVTRLLNGLNLGLVKLAMGLRGVRSMHAFKSESIAVVEVRCVDGEQYRVDGYGWNGIVSPSDEVALILWRLVVERFGEDNESEGWLYWLGSGTRVVLVEHYLVPDVGWFIYDSGLGVVGGVETAEATLDGYFGVLIGDSADEGRTAPAAELCAHAFTDGWLEPDAAGRLLATGL